MVLLIIIPMKNGYFIGNINPTFSGPNPFCFEEKVSLMASQGHSILGLNLRRRSWDANRQQHFMPPGGLPEQWDIRGMEKWDMCGI